MTACRDLDYGSFADDAPWTLDLEHLPWRAGLEETRRVTNAEVPELVRPRWRPPLRRSLRTTRHVGAALLGWALKERLQGGAESRIGLSHRLREAFEHLGPSYIKLGQILSAGQGVFPDELVDEFRSCRGDRWPDRSIGRCHKPVAVIDRIVHSGDDFYGTDNQ